MSYARLGPQSDIYLYATLERFCCCSCKLDGKRGRNRIFDDYEDIIRHLDAHSAAGDKVPSGVLHRLRAEQDEIREVPQ